MMECRKCKNKISKIAFLQKLNKPYTETFPYMYIKACDNKSVKLNNKKIKYLLSINTNQVVHIFSFKL